MGKNSAVVIADAGPLIHLDELSALDILNDFGRVIVPDAVWLEAQRHRPKVFGRANPLFVRKSIHQYSPLVNALAPLYTLHAGEQEALHLCLEFSDSLLLTDDTAARLAAKSLGVSSHGTLGLLVRAIRRQSRSKCEVLDLLRAIPARTSLHIRPSLLAEVIKDVEINAK
jgi:predicted nucleic acid-binding protein